MTWCESCHEKSKEEEKKKRWKSLGARSSYPPLGELAGTLVLADPEQLEHALLVGGEAGDLTDEVADELDTLGLGLFDKREKK